MEGALSAASIFGAQGRVCISTTQAYFLVCVGGGMWGGGKGEAFISVRKLQTGTQRASCCYNRVLEQTNAIKAKNVCEADTDQNRKTRGGVHLSLITSH